MAIGDLAKTKGLAVYPDTQDRRLGFQNDNQRGDDIAATMNRLDTVETSLSKAASGGTMVRSSVPVTLGSGAWQILDTASWWSVEQPATGQVVFDGSWTVQEDGLYEVEGGIQVDAAVALAFGIKLNSRTTGDGGGLIVSNTGAGTAGFTSAYVRRKFRFRKGDKLRSTAFLSANAVWTTSTRETSFFAIRYIEPLR
jgi:hypothetical protein